MMTPEERDAKEAIIDELYESGYAPYARLFQLFQLNLTRDPDCVAYMIPGRAVIVVNANLRIDQVSVIVRHEILHEFLTHQIRTLEYFGVDPDELSVADTQDYLDDLYRKNISAQQSRLSNIAGDYEISNVGYTDKDKVIAKHLKIDGREYPGLVTDIDHPGWEDLSFEELLDKLKEEMEKEQEEAKEQTQGEDGEQGEGDGQSGNGNGNNGSKESPDLSNVSDDFAEGWNQAIEDYRKGTLLV